MPKKMKLDITPKLRRQLRKKWGIIDLYEFLEWIYLYQDIVTRDYPAVNDHASISASEILDPNSMINCENEEGGV